MPKKIRVEMDADLALQIAALLKATAEDRPEDGRIGALSAVYEEAVTKAACDQLSYEEIARITAHRS